MTCTFVGNSDVFGVGIRIGYYAQVLAIWFSNYFYQHEVKALRATNNLFLLAAIVVGFIYFGNAAQTHAVEAFLLLQIGLTVALVGIQEATPLQSSKYRSVSDERLLLRIGIFAFGGVFNALFWWKGLDVMLATPCNEFPKEGAGTYAWYVTKVSLYGWLRTLMRVQSMFAVLWTSPTKISRDTASLILSRRSRDAREAFVQSLSPDGDSLPNLLSQVRNEPCTTTASVSFGSSNNGQPNSTSATTFSVADKQVLEEVAGAERYLNKLYAIFTDEENPPAPFKIPLSSCGLQSLIPQSQAKLRCTDSTPYLRCLWRVVLLNFSPFTWQARRILNMHHVQSTRYKSSSWPRILNRFFEFQAGAISSSNDKNLTLPGWRYLLIASDIQLFRISRLDTERAWLYGAAMHLFFITALILQVELTIAWNHVTGLNSLSALGQLIPFIIGIGGLIKVFWGKACEIRRGVSGSDVNREGKYERALRLYVERNRKPQTREGERGIVKALTF